MIEIEDLHVLGGSGIAIPITPKADLWETRSRRAWLSKKTRRTPLERFETGYLHETQFKGIALSHTG
jgi:hypothetical protein